jgi:hypothetical protein
MSLQVDAAESGGDRGDRGHDGVDVLGVQAERPRIDARESLEQGGFALQHRQRGEWADVAEPEHG